MRSWTIRFKEPTTKEQHDIIIAGLSHYSNSIQDKLTKGPMEARKKLMELGTRVVNLDMANQIMASMEAVAENIDEYFNWKKEDDKTYKVQLDIDAFNKLFNVGFVPPNIVKQLLALFRKLFGIRSMQTGVGEKISESLERLIRSEICPKMGVKYNDVEIVKGDSP